MLYLLSSFLWADECPTDDFETNNTISEATEISAVMYEDLALCGSEDTADYYQITLEANTLLSVDVSFSHVEGDIDLFLFDPTGLTDIYSSVSIDDNESIPSYLIPRPQDCEASLPDSECDPQTYYIKVELFSDTGAPGNTYSLNVETEQARSCESDQFEENDSWLLATDAIPTNSSQALTICPNDDDWFAFELDRYEQLTASVTFDHAAGDIDIALWDINNNELAISETLSDVETVQYIPETAGTYKLEVRLYQENDSELGNSYLLETVTEHVNPCGNDAYDPNETLEEAVTIEEGSYDLLACDNDWFALEVDANKNIDLNLNFTHALGDLDVLLYDSESNLLATANSSTDNEALSHPVVDAGTYYVEVILISNIEEALEYQLQYTLSDVESETTDEPSTEPSGEPTSEPTAEPTSEPSSSSKSGCQSMSLMETFAWIALAPLLLLGWRQRF